MAGKFSSKEQVRNQVYQSDAARECLNGEVRKILHALDVPSRLKSSVLSKPSHWLFGSLGSGLLAGMLFRKKRRPVVAKAPHKFSSALLALILTAAQPMVKIFLARLFEQQLRSKSMVRSRPSDSVLESNTANHP
ncbi:MAG: hypothetical protein EAZ42_03700 [Verrucomicrobia bacterium]|nr:MAG: hypothetical protein EAZ42_03700 [Verrucomicrobiota bacterium]